jgi:hypothetical protein
LAKSWLAASCVTCPRRDALARDRVVTVLEIAFPYQELQQTGVASPRALPAAAVTLARDRRATAQRAAETAGVYDQARLSV